MLYFFSVESASTKYRKTFLKSFSTKLELDNLACKGCTQEKEILKDITQHFTCPQDKSKKCMRCSINPSKQNGCKVGCFRIVDNGAHPCLIQKDYDVIYKTRKFKKQAPKKVEEPKKNEDPKKKDEKSSSSNPTPTPAKVEDPKSEEVKQIEKAQKEIFVVKPVEQDVMFFLIDSSGSMSWDSKICHTTADPKEWVQYVKEGRYVPRMKIVKEVLKNKIQSFPDKQKYFIWESNEKKSFDNLEGTKNKDDAKKFIDDINMNGVFFYEEAFKALASKIEKIDNSHTVVSLLTDGGITNEKPAESATLKGILSKGVKKWELFLYSEGGCTDPETQKEEKAIMDALKKEVGL